MSERQIAEKKVKPYLIKMGFPEDLISDYDKVMVRFGTSTCRVDLVCYYIKGDEKLPFLVVEVKKPSEDMDPIQAESYAQRLDAPFFALTNGEDYHWFLTGKGQSNYLKLKECPLPLFHEEAVTERLRLELKKDVLELIGIYEDKLKTDARKCPKGYSSCSFMNRPHEECIGCLVWNVTWFNWATKKISDLYANFRNMEGRKLAAILGDPSILWSVYPRNYQETEKWVLDHPAKTKEILEYITNEKIPIDKRFDELVFGQYKIPGIGPYLASMLFASLGNEQYTVISNRNLQGLKSLGLIDIQPTVFEGIDYMNFSKVLLELGGVFKDDLGFGWKALVHDFTLLVSNYLNSGVWRS